MLIWSLSLPVLVSVSACDKQPEIKHATVKASPLPEGKEWPGVYYSPLYGQLHIIAEGEQVQGAWRTGSGDAYGELRGKIDGDLLTYDWKERKIGMVGANAERSGKGFFKYHTKEGEQDTIKGEWGLGENEIGEKWEATKQVNAQPDLKSVKPDEFESRVKAGGWDDGEAEGDAKEEDKDKK